MRTSVINSWLWSNSILPTGTTGQVFYSQCAPASGLLWNYTRWMQSIVGWSTCIYM